MDTLAVRPVKRRFEVGESAVLYANANLNASFAGVRSPILQLNGSPESAYTFPSITLPAYPTDTDIQQWRTWMQVNNHGDCNIVPVDETNYILRVNIYPENIVEYNQFYMFGLTAPIDQSGTAYLGDEVEKLTVYNETPYIIIAYYDADNSTTYANSLVRTYRETRGSNLIRNLEHDIMVRSASSTLYQTELQVERSCNLRKKVVLQSDNTLFNSNVTHAIIREFPEI